MIIKIFKQQGTSLLEIISVLIIVGLLCVLAIPNFQQFLMRQDREVTLDRLISAIQYAKSEAIKQGNTIILCGSDNQRSCYPYKKGWSFGFILFTDPKDKKVRHPEGLYTFAGPKYGTLKLEAFGGDHQTLYLQPNGMITNNGTFTYCPHNKDPKEAMALIINQSGRIYLSTKDSEGHALTCY